MNTADQYLKAIYLVQETEDGPASTGAVADALALSNYCIIERFLANVLEVEEFRAEARSLEAVIDDTVAERLDTIIDRSSECPDCFDAETDACKYLAEVESESPAD